MLTVAATAPVQQSIDKILCYRHSIISSVPRISECCVLRVVFISDESKYALKGSLHTSFSIWKMSLIPREFKEIMRMGVQSRRIGPSDCSPLHVHQAIRSMNPPLAWLTYRASHAFRTIHKLLPMHHAAIICFAHRHRLPHIGSPIGARIAENMLVLGMPLTWVDYTHLMKINYLNNNDVVKVMFWLDMMKKHNTTPTVEPYCIAIISLARALDLKAALGLARELYRTLPGSENDVQVVICIIEAYGYGHDLSSAENIFARICKGVADASILPDKRYLNAMMRAYTVNDEFAKAKQIYQNLFADHKVPKDLETYDVMMDLYARSNDVKGAIDLWIEIHSYCLREKLEFGNLYHLPIATVDKLRLQSSVENYLVEEPYQQRLECKFLDYVYNTSKRESIISQLPPSYYHSSTFEARRFRAIRPLSSTYASLLRLLALNVRTGSFEEPNLEQLYPLYALFQSGTRYHEPLKESYDAMVWAHIKAGDYKRALEWFDGMVMDRQRVDFSQEQEMTRIRSIVDERASNPSL